MCRSAAGEACDQIDREILAGIAGDSTAPPAEANP